MRPLWLVGSALVGLVVTGIVIGRDGTPYVSVAGIFGSALCALIGLTIHEFSQSVRSLLKKRQDLRRA
jgi:hypothetical protein